MVAIFVEHNVSDAAGVVDVSRQADLLAIVDEVLRQKLTFAVDFPDDAVHLIFLVELAQKHDVMVAPDAADRRLFVAELWLRQVVPLGDELELCDS